MGYQEYPKVMKHPSHEPAEWKKQPGKGEGLFAPDTVMTKAERFPDVTVYTLEQEKQQAALGYRPANMGDAREYERAILESQPEDGYHYQEYPKWKYHPVQLPVIVQSKQEEVGLGDGWCDRPVEATDDDLEPEDEEPEQTAPVQTSSKQKSGGKKSTGKGARA